MNIFFNFCCGMRQKDDQLSFYGDKELSTKHPVITAILTAIT